jgi:hypothetical protein
VRVARGVARVFGWVFVGVIAYHAGLAVQKAVHAGSHGNWSYAIEMSAIAIVTIAIVVGAVVGSVRLRRR